MSDKFKLLFVSRSSEPAKNPPDPKFPDGMHLDISAGYPSCNVQLPYPAPGVGYWAISCTECNARHIVTAAGRKDDPRSVKMACPLKVS